MDTASLRKLLHDLSNALNAAKINAYLLRRTSAGALDADAINGLDSSLHDAEILVGEYQRRVHAEIAQAKTGATATA